MHAKSTPWLVKNQQTLGQSHQLIIFPYAGGSAGAFRQWNKVLPQQIGADIVQLPGRETRFSEPYITDFQVLVKTLTNNLLPNLRKPFAFFGHSMGALLCFEVTRSLYQIGAPKPEHLFISGHIAPQDTKPKNYSQQENDEFIETVKKMGGLPNEILQHPELLQIVLSTLRADFRTIETYQYRNTGPLDIPITALGGKEDEEATEENLSAWKIHTSKEFRLKMFPGNHFYLNSELNALITEISQTFLSYR